VEKCLQQQIIGRPAGKSVIGKGFEDLVQNVMPGIGIVSVIHVGMLGESGCVSYS
jgi:hypothetical protein